MGIAGKIKDMSAQAQYGVQKSSVSLVHIILRLISGFFIGFVLALILQEIFQTGALILTFFTVLFMALIYKGLSHFSIGKIIIFDLICVLVGALLRMYIMLAP